MKNKKPKSKIRHIAYSKQVTFREKVDIIPHLVKYLKTECGKKGRVVSNPQLKNAMLKYHYLKMASATVRKYLHYIRVNGHVKLLIANNRGYHIAKNTIEVTDYLKCLQKRIREIGVLKRAIDQQSHTVLGKQIATKMKSKKKKSKTSKTLRNGRKNKR